IIRTAGSTYALRLKRLLDSVQDFWGTPFSARALGICIVLQTLYSSFLFLLFWANGGAGSLGRTALLPTWQDSASRWGFFLGFVLYSSRVILTIRYSAEIADRIVHFVSPLRPAGMSQVDRAHLTAAGAKPPTRGTFALIAISSALIFTMLVPAIHLIGGTQ